MSEEWSLTKVERSNTREGKALGEPFLHEGKGSSVRRGGSFSCQPDMPRVVIPVQTCLVEQTEHGPEGPWHRT